MRSSLRFLVANRSESGAPAGVEAPKGVLTSGRKRRRLSNAEDTGIDVHIQVSYKTLAQIVVVVQILSRIADAVLGLDLSSLSEKLTGMF